MNDVIKNDIYGRIKSAKEIAAKALGNEIDSKVIKNPKPKVSDVKTAETAPSLLPECVEAKGLKKLMKKVKKVEVAPESTSSSDSMLESQEDKKVKALIQAKLK